MIGSKPCRLINWKMRSDPSVNVSPLPKLLPPVPASLCNAHFMKSLKGDEVLDMRARYNVSLIEK